MEVPIPPQFPPETRKSRRFSAALLVGILLVGLVAGGLVGYVLSYSALNGKIDDVQSQLQNELRGLPPSNATYVSYPNTNYLLGDNVSLAQLYKQVQQSVVVIRGLIVQHDIFRRTIYSEVQGSGFVAEVNGQKVVVTNNHVVQGMINCTVTFTDGMGYAAKVLGADPYADLAVLALEDSPAELQPLEIVSSSYLQAGDPVVAVGSPYGLAGSVTVGIVSALGRTITEDLSGGVSIAGVIQTSTLINPGNSGGPLVNYAGQVVGVTTAIVSNSQGLGFAIPSNTILREISSLVTTGSYDQHPLLDAAGVDMTYEIAQTMGTNMTYGWLVVNSNVDGLHGGTRQAAVLGSVITVGGDIVTAINGVRVTNTDDLLTYLEENTLPGQTVDLTVVRGSGVLTTKVTLGTLS
ncbi:MAG: S1C family serine protease [Candidatus Bathyarchaeia archaeon]